MDAALVTFQHSSVHMIQFSKILLQKGGSDFAETFKREAERLDARLLPLQQGLTAGGYALDDSFNVMFIGVTEKENSLLVKAGIFYRGVISGCSCADDPSPADETNEYCEVLFEINKLTGEGSVTLAEA